MPESKGVCVCVCVCVVCGVRCDGQSGGPTGDTGKDQENQASYKNRRNNASLRSTLGGPSVFRRQKDGKQGEHGPWPLLRVSQEG